MANHKSAKKRAKQSLKRNLVNRSLLNKLRNSITNFKNLLLSKQTSKRTEDLQESFRLVNSFLARAAKKRLIKKEFVSRKLSSLSKQIKNI